MKKSTTIPTELHEQVESTMKAVGRRICAERRKLRLTQVEFAERLGIDQNSVSKYERGAVDLSVGRLMHLALVLNIDWVEFIMPFREKEPSFEEAAADLKRLLESGKAQYGKDVPPVDAPIAENSPAAQEAQVMDKEDLSALVSKMIDEKLIYYFLNPVMNPANWQAGTRNAPHINETAVKETADDQNEVK